ncbi:hypothetical protein BV20DRAFT_964416 [Pilatotrama ljubarskyi]|nr:hypothetical protein BV20DRAFT_964416 [Pilatotrama ljubarskyi]
MFATKLTAVFAALAAAATAVTAAPAYASTFTSPKTEIVFRPHVTSPKAGDVWPAGSVQTVTWDTSDIPEESKNQTGLILLGYIEGDDINEHLDVANPLAVNFPITAGSAQVKVPEVTPRNDYVVVLFGDSGNTSPKFTITTDAGSSLPSISLPSITGTVTASASTPASPSVSASVSSVAVPPVSASVSTPAAPSVSASAAAAASA